MGFHIHPGLRYVLYRAALDALPGLAVASGFIYGLVALYSQSYHVVFGFGALIMLLVAVARFATHLMWLGRASQVLATAQPVPMYLTADRGWKSITLSPAESHEATSSIIGASFITLGSGIATMPQQNTPVQIYLDNANPTCSSCAWRTGCYARK